MGTATVAAGPPCDLESTIHCVVVEADDARPGGRTLVLDDAPADQLLTPLGWRR